MRDSPEEDKLVLRRTLGSHAERTSAGAVLASTINSTMTRQRFDPGSVHAALRKLEADFDWELTFLFVDDVGGDYYPVTITYQLREIAPSIDDVLSEAERLLDVNPSASLVWAAQAFELFVKEGLLRPALLYRLAWDADVFTELYKMTVERNGGRGVASLLGPLTGLELDRLQEGSGLNIWQRIQDEKDGVIARRNRIIHRGDMALIEEAREALGVVRAFAKLVRDHFESKTEQLVKSIKKVEVDLGNHEKE